MATPTVVDKRQKPKTIPMAIFTVIDERQKTQRISRVDDKIRTNHFPPSFVKPKTIFLGIVCRRMGATATTHHTTLTSQRDRKVVMFFNGAAVPVYTANLSFSSLLVLALERGRLLRFARGRRGEGLEKSRRGVVAPRSRVGNFNSSAGLSIGLV